MAYLRIEKPSGGIDVSDIIAKLVVARVVPISGFTAKHQLFFFRLKALCTSGDTTTRNTISDESITTILSVNDFLFPIFGNESRQLQSG